MKASKRSPWVDALIRIDTDPKAAIACLKCGDAKLRVQDVAVQAEDCVRFSRYLICDACGASVVADGRRPRPGGGADA